MHALRVLTIATLSFATAALAGCGDDEPRNENKSCSVQAQTGCESGQVCEEVEGAEPACFAPVSFKGIVTNALDDKPIQGARIVARDANDAAVSPVAISAADGTYTLAVPARRDSAGKPVAAKLTLRADASGYQTFPLAPRIALPIDVDTAAGSPPVVQTAATDIALVPLPNASGLGSIAGTVVADAGLDLVPAGALVIAGGSTGIVDFKGNFVVFNVPANASVDVQAYAAGLQITPKTVAVEAGKQTENVELRISSAATADVSGKLSIVNGNGNSVTSVVLALEDTFVENAARGEVPKGLRVGNVTGDFVFNDVPDGKYVVLAAFENDGLVRDPDTSIGGTQIVHIEVAGQNITLAEGFKVTGSLATVSPGKDAIEEVTGTPTFVWADDSSEDMYELRVFDAFGVLVWEDLAVPSVSGSKDVTVQYGGEALTPGMIYQFRATSMKDGVPISQTEDLRGVFVAR
ncbi:hypothetical protein [Polyangium spumosum]|uniref:Carboxypeptidase regulatory-like domain-containing protein n=1 Tax=Polyangium spumosum TaxID=889282 RepID=A0A6N7PS54_9BACT|nr:hypothetical protein [Polyangium spumosum]MRG92884.1 hypothetical protein [Polyangium spumosum]